MKKTLTAQLAIALILTTYVCGTQLASAQYTPEPTPLKAATQAVEDANETTTTDKTTTQQTEETKPTKNITKSTTQESAPDKAINLPTPELPVLNLDTTSQTQETQSTIEQTQTAGQISDEMSSKIIAPLLNNQMIILMIVFLGAILGMILTLAAMLLINIARTRGK
jgi:cell division protein FtsX